MPLQYRIEYHAINTYDAGSKGAVWQFLITPEINESQHLENAKFINSIDEPATHSINGYGFTTFRIHTKKEVNEISFKAVFTILKDEINPFEKYKITDLQEDYATLDTLSFRAYYEPFLKETKLTTLPKAFKNYFIFDTSVSIFENLQKLNHKVFKSINFSSGVTHTDTTLEEILQIQSGVCQDFAHLFCAVARENKIPTRYVSGYLHQGSGFFGDSQMHAWVECYVPNMGWVGFDPTNNILADHHHIKVCHGKNYTDCAPIKGIVYTAGSNETIYNVSVASQQQ